MPIPVNTKVGSIAHWLHEEFNEENNIEEGKEMTIKPIEKNDIQSITMADITTNKSKNRLEQNEIFKKAKLDPKKIVLVVLENKLEEPEMLPVTIIDSNTGGIIINVVKPTESTTNPKDKAHFIEYIDQLKNEYPQFAAALSVCEKFEDNGETTQIKITSYSNVSIKKKNANAAHEIFDKKGIKNLIPALRDLAKKINEDHVISKFINSNNTMAELDDFDNSTNYSQEVYNFLGEVAYHFLD
ncbi:hypothetical protein COEREDRAFT_87699 [Coemansia reversa NRRL 1564]|uniref:Uncharacterized protein n=1 Tax=Coemansia reversa (strain ATCC 12441 / NRRL 1564) TaxID=763665 RepID=A0A2G5B922_COERN|nr:hypothetical protein COEREDRAFT_87699 [Coemansia reversa NRRL 1564]|eukprot:PIA15504.1 hypothetical protein COEREDRAFT_87699 [Coemansia reversa NRRL 1564]